MVNLHWLKYTSLLKRIKALLNDVVKRCYKFIFSALIDNWLSVAVCFGMDKINVVFELMGGVGAVASACNVSPQQAHQWKTGARPVPPQYCPLLEQKIVALGGNVTRKELRPDDWAKIWPELIEKA